MVCFVLTPRCFAYRHAATTFYQLQRGFGGQEASCADPGIILLFQLILKFKEVFHCFIAEKTILILYKGSRGRPLFSGGGGGGGGGPTFSSRGGGGSKC